MNRTTRFPIAVCPVGIAVAAVCTPLRPQVFAVPLYEPESIQQREAEKKVEEVVNRHHTAITIAKYGIS